MGAIERVGISVPSQGVAARLDSSGLQFDPLSPLGNRVCPVLLEIKVGVSRSGSNNRPF